jgi:hypothetical protein
MALFERYTVRIRAAARDRASTDMAGFLDMLRYDRPTVETWDYSVDTFTVTLIFPDRPPTFDRWASFGLTLARKV